MGEAAEREWIDHDGGECPVNRDAIVDVKFPSGGTMLGYLASDWMDGPTDWWQHTRTHDQDDIIAYRVVRP